MPNDCKITKEEVWKLAQNELEKIDKKTGTTKVCMAVMTSGTTGIPKIYFRTCESWAGFFGVQNKIFQVTKDIRLFTQGSLAFTGNLNLYLAQFYAGGTVIAQETFWPKSWQQAIVLFLFLSLFRFFRYLETLLLSVFILLLSCFLLSLFHFCFVVT